MAKENHGLEKGDDWAAYSTCSRTCEWFRIINEATYPDTDGTVADELLRINEAKGQLSREQLMELGDDQVEDPEYFARYIYTPDDAALFEVYCAGKGVDNLELYGFADRDEVGLSNSNSRISFPGDVFWSNGRL